ncbi:MAG: hypothetical protein HC803_03385 [Saprospiraceae bacterium]|nr:hypothetical protein [Saprospiraceae bacterium]
MEFKKPNINWSKPEFNKALLIKVIIGILIVGNVWFIVKNRISNNRHAQEKQELVTAYELKLAENTKKQLELVTKTFVWSIRSEMIRDNYDQVGLYFNQLVKEDDRVTEIIAIDKKGTMVVSTNKRYEGKAFKSIYDEAILESNDVIITHDGDVFRIVAPILALNSKIGTLFMLYKPDEEMLKIADELETQQEAVSEGNSDSTTSE